MEGFHLPQPAGLFFTVELFRSLWAAGASFVGWNGSVRFRQRGFLERWKGSVRFRLRCFLERWKGSVRFRLRCFLERWRGSVRFRLRCASFITGERDRVGGARRRAPNTPGSPFHPRRFAVPSAYRVRLRDRARRHIPVAHALLRHPCRQPRPPAHTSARAMGSNTPAVISGDQRKNKISL